MKLLSSLFLSASLLATTSFADSRNFFAIPANLIREGVVQLGATASNCTSFGCDLIITDVVCSNSFVDPWVELSCTATDAATGKKLYLMHTDSDSEDVYLQSALYSLGYETKGAASWTKSSAVKQIKCSTVENSYCTVIE